VLGSDPKGKNFLYTNGNSVIIRNIEVSMDPCHLYLYIIHLSVDQVGLILSEEEWVSRVRRSQVVECVWREFN